MAVQRLPGEIVKKSNAIARARWQPESIWEPRIVALVASKVREDDEDFLTYRIPVAELTGVSDENLCGNQYRDIAKAIGHLGKATLRIQGNKPRNFRQYNIFAMCGYEDGYLIAGLHPDLKPHFLHLKSQFTAYNLMEYLTLPSAYSQRMFEFIKSWSNAPEVLISVVELHEMLNTPESFRKDFRQFRTRVLAKAHKDITANTSLRYEWEVVKKGRSYVSVRFIFGLERKAIAEASIQAKRSAANNKAFKAAAACLKERGPVCEGGHQKEKVCELCRIFR
jgi:plasmid replication initiation protein